ncbi:MAG: tRNA adenosine(34) deaminase TadA [Nitrospirae bacterium]|nr:tRNA adenosine(34) deaminase TadA [Nitrospirota bacterium]
MNHEYFMRLAIKEAEAAFREGEVPVGALIVRDDRVIAMSHNNKEVSVDPTAHAEIMVIRQAASEANNWRLTDAALYVTKEPCIMCAGAIVNARLGRLVYGCRDTKGGAVDSLYNLLSDKRLNHQVEVIAGILENDCASLLSIFFRKLRP